MIALSLPHVASRAHLLAFVAPSPPPSARPNLNLISWQKFGKSTTRSNFPTLNAQDHGALDSYAIHLSAASYLSSPLPILCYRVRGWILCSASDTLFLYPSLPDILFSSRVAFGGRCAFLPSVVLLISSLSHLPWIFRLGIPKFHYPSNAATRYSDILFAHGLTGPTYLSTGRCTSTSDKLSGVPSFPCFVSFLCIFSPR